MTKYLLNTYEMANWVPLLHPCGLVHISKLLLVHVLLQEHNLFAQMSNNCFFSQIWDISDMTKVQKIDSKLPFVWLHNLRNLIYNFREPSKSLSIHTLCNKGLICARICFLKVNIFQNRRKCNHVWPFWKNYEICQKKVPNPK